MEISSEKSSAIKNKFLFLDRKKAVLMNFTADSYHWGCYGTSMEIYDTLLEAGYYIDAISVNIIHQTSPTVQNLDDFNSNNFFKKFAQLNSELCRTLQTADLIVVNGEGTLHGLNKAPLNLLYLMLVCKKYFQKRVHLINFSCFPNGDASMPNNQTLVYPEVLKKIDKVIVRERVSEKILQNFGVDARLGFDCLPRFLHRHNLTNSHTPQGHVLISGGVSLSKDNLEIYIKLIEWLGIKAISTRFLVGAKSNPAPEDLKLWEFLKAQKNIKKIEIVTAKTMSEWVDEFRYASFLFSARFHHTIAALSIGTPFEFFPSNTPKISAILETLNESSSITSSDESGLNKVKNAINFALINKTTIKSESRVDSMLNLAANNFT